MRNWINLVQRLNEAPIGDIQVHGDFSKPGSFQKDDLSLASPKRQDIIKRVLQKAPILIDLHFVNHPHRIDITTHLKNANKIGYLTPERLEEYWGVNIVPNPNALNLIYLQNEGDRRIPMTPWIIAHRLSHAFEYMRGHDEFFIMRVVNDDVRDAFLKVQDMYEPVPFQAMLSQSEIVNHFGTTRASRQELIRDGNALEMVHECFAQLCVVGDIRFNKAPEQIGEHEISEYHTTVEVDDVFDDLRSKLIAAFTDALDQTVGKLLVF